MDAIDECPVKEKCYWFRQAGEQKCKIFSVPAMWQTCRARTALEDLLAEKEKNEKNEKKVVV